MLVLCVVFASLKLDARGNCAPINPTPKRVYGRGYADRETLQSRASPYFFPQGVIQMKPAVASP